MRAHGRLWSLLLLALVSAAATAASIAAGTGDGSAAGTIRVIVATTPHVGVSLPATTASPPPTTAPAPQPTVTTGALPAAPGAPSTPTTTSAPPPATTPTRPPRKPAIRTWPPGRSGYTAILVSIPQSTGRAAALERARAARAAGLTQVGILDSSRHPSLRGGYWVVFSGIEATEARAQAAAADARAHGFPGAYPARVSS